MFAYSLVLIISSPPQPADLSKFSFCNVQATPCPAYAYKRMCPAFPQKEVVRDRKLILL